MKTTAELIDYLNLLYTNLEGRPTFIYNESWMLRLVLNWFSGHKDIGSYYLSMNSGTRWYPQALLPSPFLRTPLRENYTEADAVYGDLEIGDRGDTDVKLIKPCRQFAVVEAKMNSPYSPDVTHASEYNQAARTVACMSKVIELSGQPVDAIEKIAFFTLLPAEKAKREQFKDFTSKDHIEATVNKRIKDCIKGEENIEINNWYENYFQPMLKKIEIDLIAWEDIITDIEDFDTNNPNDPHKGGALYYFYEKCEDPYNKRK
jgi:hypothetical protein